MKKTNKPSMLFSYGFGNKLVKKWKINKWDLFKYSWNFGFFLCVKTCDEQLTRLGVFQFVWFYWTLCWEYEDKKYHSLYFHDDKNCFLGIRNSLALGRFSLRICIRVFESPLLCIWRFECLSIYSEVLDLENFTVYCSLTVMTSDFLSNS